MENLLAVTFEAHNPALNHHRRYEIRVGRDLFGEWTVAFEYGRSGKRGQIRRHASPDAAVMQETVLECLRRRRSAPGRIGCGYRMIHVDAADGFAVDPWLPPDLVGTFQ